MNWKHRAVRFVVALTIAGIIGAQIPSTGGVALAQRDDYPEGEESGGGEAVRIAAGAATVLGIASIVSGSAGGGLAGGGGVGPVITGGSGVGIGPQVVPPVAVGQPIWDVSNTTDELNQFAKLSEAGGYKEELRKSGQFTAFVPTNGAFDKLGAGALADLTSPANQARLGQLVASHVIIGRKTIDDLRREATAAGVDGVQYDTINGRKLRVTIDANQTLRVNGVIIRESDVQATNGVIHPILDVINPDAPAGGTDSAAPAVAPAPAAP